MKRFIFTLFILFFISSSVFAQIEEKTKGIEEKQTPMTGQKMQMMQCPMMEMMTKHSEIMQGLLSTLKDILITQRRLLKGLSTDEKQSLLQDIEKMLKKIENMQNDMNIMMKNPEVPKKNMGEIQKEENQDKKSVYPEEHKQH